MHYSSIEFEIRRYVNDGDISEIKDILELVDEDKDNIIQIGMGICCYDDVPSLYLFTSSVPENNIEERTVRKYFCDFSDDEGWERFVSVIKQLDNEYKNIKQSANCEVGENICPECDTQRGLFGTNWLCPNCDFPEQEPKENDA